MVTVKDLTSFKQVVKLTDHQWWRVVNDDDNEIDYFVWPAVQNMDT